MLQTSGAISISDVAVELGLAASTNLTLDDSRVRKLAKKEAAGTAIGLGDLYGKSNFQYTVTQMASGGVTSWIASQGTGWYSYHLGYDIDINTPSGIIVTGCKFYDINNALISSHTMPADGQAAYDPSKSSLYIVPKKVNGTRVNNALWIGYYNNSSGMGTYSHTTISRIEVIDSNGNVYELDIHRNCFPMKYARISVNSQPNSSTYLSRSDVKAWNGVTVPPNYP